MCSWNMQLAIASLIKQAVRVGAVAPRVFNLKYLLEACGYK